MTHKLEMVLKLSDEQYEELMAKKGLEFIDAFAAILGAKADKVHIVKIIKLKDPE